MAPDGRAEPPPSAHYDSLLSLLLRNSAGRDGGDGASDKSAERPRAGPLHYCDNYETKPIKSCDLPRRALWSLALACVLLALASAPPSHQEAAIIIDHHQHQQQQQHQQQHNNQRGQLPQHFQPASLVLAQNRSINFTHVAYDELTNSIYVGATNWLFQVSARDLRIEQAIRTGPASGAAELAAAAGGGGGGAQQQQQQQAAAAARDCSPADCLTQLALVHDLESLALAHAPLVSDLSQAPGVAGVRRPHSGATMHTNSSAARRAQLAQPVPATTPTSLAATSGAQQQAAAAAATPSGQSQQQQQQQQQQGSTANNYNKLLAIDYDSRHLLVCGSLNQGACRRHQLGNLGNFSELIPVPVASNDEHSSTVALIPRAAGPLGRRAPGEPVIYVAATNSRLGPYRDYVPAISARSLDFSSRDRSLQIVERAFDRASVDISFELRDYYLVNYVHAFQHQEFVYFVTLQRKSPLRQLEESGYATRLARLCLNDLSFQSYTEMTLECVAGAGERAAHEKQPHGAAAAAAAAANTNQRPLNYNLVQDAQLVQAGSHLQQQLGLGRQAASGWLLAATFAQSRDHTTRSGRNSAICLFPMHHIEARFSENIELCYNGTTKSRNMNYIAGSVNDCPRPPTNSLANYCNEPIKLNGSLALTAEPVASFPNELLTSIGSTLAPTSPLSLEPASGQPARQPGHTGSTRQHQVLLAGTADGQLKRLVLVADSASQKIRALQFDSLQVVAAGGSGEPAPANASGPAEQTPAAATAILAGLQLVPRVNPQLQLAAPDATGAPNRWHQYALVASRHKLAKVRVNACRHASSRLASPAAEPNSNGSTVDECLACAQLQDPFCGWCASSASCGTRDECLAAGLAHQRHHQPAPAIHWTPFDSIRCSNYQPISPKNIALQAEAPGGQPQVIDVNVRINASQQQAAGGAQLASRLAHARFTCHFDYLAFWNRSEPARPAAASTKASQARMSLHANTVAIGCPMPAQAQRPARLPAGHDHLKVRLSVRLDSMREEQLDELEARQERALIERALGMRAGASPHAPPAAHQAEPLERELTLFDCAAHSNCHACLSAGSLGRRWACAWCPLSARCTHNATHADFGCAASAVASTTPHSHIRGSHLTASLDRAQASVLALAIDKLHQCPARELEPSERAADGEQQQQLEVPESTGAPASARPPQPEVLVAHQSRRSIQVPLGRPIQHFQREKQRVTKLECWLELEGAKARYPARLLDSHNVACQESAFSYQSEVALQRATLSVILNEQQVIETIEVILYKCHLFGINPPALTSSVAPAASPLAHHSSASWAAKTREFLALVQSGAHQAAINQEHQQQQQLTAAGRARLSDCSLCLNVERKYQCAWCSNQCKHADQCHELPASTCPPPRIDSIHPNSGPLEGGTLLTIEGSNLGSNEREIQDKILVGGEPCQLVMYSVSTRIVCKTSASASGPQAATVFVGNRAGVTSAYEKFHYKAIHLTDVNPRMGPVSGGTRLFLSGANLNSGSRVQVYLDEVACPLDSQYELASNQIVCITPPNLLLNSMRVARLTLLVDNASLQLPYPFVYQPDPIITAIEPAESFLSGGRLLLVTGHHLAAPQTTKLLLYHEHRPSLTNTTTCMKQNDTLITCLTPAFSRDQLLSAAEHQDEPEDQDGQQQQQQSANQASSSSPLAYEAGGVKLKMALLLDDVRSARHLDEYYHHLPHALAYFEDPRLFKLPSQLVEYRDELHIAGEHLRMRQLDQDMLITIGAHVCPIKSILADRVVCAPAARIAPVYLEAAHAAGPVERPILAIVALIGSNLRYELGFMQYSSSQYLQPAEQPFNRDQQQQPPAQQQEPIFASNYNGLFVHSPPVASERPLEQQQQQAHNYLASLPVTPPGVLVAFRLTLTFAMARFLQSKAKQREYKRIQQLQMGSLDINGQPMTAAAFANGQLFDQIQQANYLHHQQQQQQQFRATMAKTKPFYQFFTSASQQQQQQPAGLPASDMSQQQHVVKLHSNGTIVSNVSQPAQCASYTAATSTAAASSPGGSNSSSSRQLLSAGSSGGAGSAQVQHYAVGQLTADSDRANLLHQPAAAGRNFNWTQEAPSTIVPYAVIEACNLTLEGKKALRDYV